MAILIDDVDQLPAVTRNSGRNSEESLAIQEHLRSGKVGKISDVTGKNTFNSLQQRVRAAAKKIGVKVVIRSVKTGETEVDGEPTPIFDLYFVDSSTVDEEETSPKSKK